MISNPEVAAELADLLHAALPGLQQRRDEFLQQLGTNGWGRTEHGFVHESGRRIYTSPVSWSEIRDEVDAAQSMTTDDEGADK